MTDQKVVELHKVSKTFPNGVRAVDDVSLTIQAGQVVALLGPSGCGKTTTLRLMNRLEEATAGKILIRSEDVRRQRGEALRRSIGYVIQEGGLFPHRDVSDNVATVPRLLRWPRTRIRARVADVLDLVGLPEKDFGRRMPAQLSGGQRQRVGVARALAADPDLLLMDEPFGALDPGTREALQDEFLALQEKLHKTVVIVTHDIAEAGKLADLVVLMERGRIAQSGSLRELLLTIDSGRNAFLGTQGKNVGLEALRLRHILDELPAVPTSEHVIHLSPQAKLGQVLLAITKAPENAVVTVAGRGTFSATAIRQVLLNEFHEEGRE